MKVKRHPIRAFIGGLVLGLGISVLLTTYAKVAFGRPNFVILPLVVAVVCLLLALFMPARGPRDTTAQPAPAPAPAPVGARAAAVDEPVVDEPVAEPVVAPDAEPTVAEPEPPLVDPEAEPPADQP